MASIIERACDSIPEFRQKYEKFSKELHVQQYSSGTITGYCHQLATLCFHFKKVPEDLSQEEVRDYLSCLSSGNSCKISKFKHTIYSLRCYRKMMSLSAWHFSLPRIRKSKKLPVVFSCEEILLFLSSCEGLRSRAIFSLIYSCGLRVSELRHMQISHIDSRRMQVLIYQGKGKKDRYVPLSAQTLLDLRAYFPDISPSSISLTAHRGIQLARKSSALCFVKPYCLPVSVNPVLCIPCVTVTPLICWSLVKTSYASGIFWGIRTLLQP